MPLDQEEVDPNVEALQEYLQEFLQEEEEGAVASHWEADEEETGEQRRRQSKKEFV